MFWFVYVDSSVCVCVCVCRYLGPPFTSGNPRMPSGPRGGQLPVPVAHTLSYQSPSQLLWAKEAGLQVRVSASSLPACHHNREWTLQSLQNDLAKVVRYCKKLPDKEQSLVKVS